MTQARFEGVRVLAGAKSSDAGWGAGAPAPAAAPAPAPAVAADSMFNTMFGFHTGGVLPQAKAVALQLIYPNERRYNV